MPKSAFVFKTGCNYQNMSSVNKVILVGHLGKDPDFKRFAGNVAFASFPLATTETILQKGLKVEQTEWHNIVLWRGFAEAARQLLRKGQLVYVEGKIRTRSFEDKEKVLKYITEIVVDDFSLLGAGGGEWEEHVINEKNPFNK